jgi:hypothetical protein
MATDAVNASRIAVLQRMLSDPDTVRRLPDKGVALQLRLDALLRGGDPTVTSANTVCCHPAPVATSSSANDTPVAPLQDELERLSIQMREGERTRHERPNIRATFEARFKGVLSQKEIDRLLEGTAGTFATWDETEGMLEREREAARTAELERLRRITAPPTVTDTSEN